MDLGLGLGHAVRTDALDEGLLEAVGGGDVGRSRREDVGVQEGLAQPDEGEGEGVGFDDGSEAELVHVAPEEGLDEGDDTGLHPPSGVGQHTDRECWFVGQQPVQRSRLGYEGVDVSSGTGRVERPARPFGLPTSLSQQERAFGDPPECLAEEVLTGTGVAEQGGTRHAKVVGQGLHLQAAPTLDPGRCQRHGAAV